MKVERYILVLVLCSLFLIPSEALARTARIYGYVVDQDNVGIELANVAVVNSYPPFGTATNKNGYYELVLEEADTVVLNFSMIGYTSVQQRILDLHDVININVQIRYTVIISITVQITKPCVFTDIQRGELVVIAPK